MPKNKHVILNQQFSSDKRSRNYIMEIINRHISKYKKDFEITIDEILLAIDEALTNAMEHGNKWSPDKKIDLIIFHTPQAINITIRDEGDGFSNKFINDDISNLEILGPRGRGIYIIHQFCNPTWNKTGNEVNLEIKFKTRM